MTLDMNAITYNVDRMKKKHTGLTSHQMVPRAPEEIFMLTNLAPACHGKYITNEYVLKVDVGFNGCTCCSTLPQISIPMTIIPMTHPESYGFTEPAGYMPVELGYFKFDLEYYQF